MGAKGIHVFSTCTSEKDIVSLPFSLVKFVRVNGNASSVLDFTDSFALFVLKKKKIYQFHATDFDGQDIAGKIRYL